MNKCSNNTNVTQFQLISVSIELVHHVLAMKDSLPDLIDLPRLDKICNIAEKWNELFVNGCVKSKNSKEGVKA